MRDGLEVLIVDACQRADSLGSRTAVVFEKPGLDDTRRGRVPAAVGASHAVFIRAEPEPGSGSERGSGLGTGSRPGQSVKLRFFTSEGELTACGHGTIAALAALADQGAESLRLGTAAHELDGWAHPVGDGVFDACFVPGPVELRDAVAEEVEAVADGLRLRGDQLLGGSCVATLARPRLLLPVGDSGVLAGIVPDFSRLRGACDRLGFLGCYVYSGPEPDGRVAARMFAPSIGVPEDIANANSTACLATLLATHGTESLTVEMGDSLGRPATIGTRIVDGRVRLTGRAAINGTTQVEV